MKTCLHSSLLLCVLISLKLIAGCCCSFNVTLIAGCFFFFSAGVVIIDDHPEVTTTEDPQSSTNDDGFTEVVSRKQQKRLQDEEKRKKEEQTTQVWEGEKINLTYTHNLKKKRLIVYLCYRTQVKRALERRAEVVGENCHQGLQRSSRHRNHRPRRLSLPLVPCRRLSSSHPVRLPNITSLPLSPLQILRL